MFDEINWGADETKQRIERIRYYKLIGRTVRITFTCLTIGLVIWICSTTIMLQTDTLNTQNLQQQEINDLDNRISNMELLYQTEQKNVSAVTDEPIGTYLGDYTITYYCGCEKCCGKTDKITKLGTTATAGRTVGADWNVIAPTTKIYIEGVGERVVEDTGGGIQDNHIDVYVDSHQEALNLGRATRKVYTVE